MKTRRATLGAILLATAFLWLSAGEPLAGESIAPRHEPLRLRNTFQTPEDVVRYYCARDASGFVFTGLLDSERKAFTLWASVPEADVFYVAKSYKVGGARYSKKNPDEAEVEVTYQLAGMSDLHGTHNPAPEGPMSVWFGLKRSQGIWRIETPSPGGLSPVILEGRFPTQNTARK